jgi:DNA polymerase I-like protein with 3'-5' exonuclease and polymerase domains
VHDEVLSSCPRDKAKEWKKIQEDAMQKAANAFLDDGLLGVDTEILDRWTK